MRRIASHYIYWRQFYRLHYVELNDNGVLAGIFPLEGEIAGTEFYDGILILVPIPVHLPQIRYHTSRVRQFAHLVWTASGYLYEGV